jgi:hypothetical protein
MKDAIADTNNSVPGKDKELDKYTLSPIKEMHNTVFTEAEVCI